MVAVEALPRGHYFDAAQEAQLLAWNAWLAVDAKTYGYKLAKTYDIFESPVTAGHLNTLLSNDNIHPTGYGPRLLAEAILNAL